MDDKYDDNDETTHDRDQSIKSEQRDYLEHIKEIKEENEMMKK